MKNSPTGPFPETRGVAFTTLLEYLSSLLFGLTWRGWLYFSLCNEVVFICVKKINYNLFYKFNYDSVTRYPSKITYGSSYNTFFL
jgi:hypothetical protein